MTIKINISTKNLEINDLTRQYIEDKIATLEKLINPEKTSVANVEIGKINNRQLKGKIFYTEINLKIDGDVLISEEIEETILASIDKSKDDMARQLKKISSKNIARRRKGARTIKSDLLKK